MSSFEFEVKGKNIEGTYIIGKKILYSKTKIFNFIFERICLDMVRAR